MGFTSMWITFLHKQNQNCPKSGVKTQEKGKILNFFNFFGEKCPKCLTKGGGGYNK